MSYQDASVADFMDKLEALHHERGGAVTPTEIRRLMSSSLGEDQQMDALTDSIRTIAGKVSTFKLELMSGDADAIADDKIPDASKELNAILESTESAANSIMDAAEKGQEEAMMLDDDTQQAAILEQVTAIFEASNFQDLTGQRITKVVNLLIEIDEIVSELLNTLRKNLDIEVSSIPEGEEDGDSDEDLLNGPQLNEDVPSQDDIDALFDSL